MRPDLTSRVEVHTLDGGTRVSVYGPSSVINWVLPLAGGLLLSIPAVWSLASFIQTPGSQELGEFLIVGILVVLFWSTFAWQTLGVESILIGDRTLGHHKRLMGWSRSKYYEIAAITRAWWGASEIPVGDGPAISAISFSYGRRTIHIFKQASSYEASFILDALEKTAGIPQK